MKLRNPVFRGTIATLFLCALMAKVPAFAQVGLKIVIIDGEDGVNIIRQNTAVKPIVEVRDRNNLPVAGVLVKFLLPGQGSGGAFANGAKEFSVTTNAVGRAQAADIALQGTGSFEIQASAEYQGETATTTIKQTNFNTASEATQAGRTPGSSLQNPTPNLTPAVANIQAGAGLARLTTFGVLGGALAATAVSVNRAKETECSSRVDLLASSVQNTESVCSVNFFNLTCPISSQCRSSAQKTLSDMGEFCACQGSLVPLASQFGVTQAQFTQAGSVFRQQGFAAPPSCGF